VGRLQHRGFTPGNPGLESWDSERALLVAADTSLINHLLLIGHIEMLPALFKK
jgi:hypothetical protein